MLSPNPHADHDDHAALFAVVDAWRRFNWDRFLLGYCAAFHLGTALVLALFPAEKLLNAGTEPVFQLLPAKIWALLFIGGFFSLGAMFLVHSRALQFVTLIGVLFLGGAWLTAFLLAVIRGEGSPLSIVIWPFLYGPWLILAARLASGKR